MPCEEERGGDCEKRGAGYEIWCKEKECTGKGAKCAGETGRNGYTRGEEHRKGKERGDKENTMVRHDMEHHGGGKGTRFGMRVTGTFGRDNVRRKVDEAVRIWRNKGERAMNRKEECRQSGLPRLVVQDGGTV